VSTNAPVVPKHSRFARAWSELRLAARGSKHDYTQGSVARAIFLLSVPMVLEMAMESVFVVVDIFWVAHLGAEAVAVVGLTESIMIIVYTLAMGLSIGATATVARRIGEKDPDGAAHAAVQAIALGFLVSGTIAILGSVLAPRLLSAMGADSDVISTGTTYARVALGGSVTAFMLFIVNSVFRGAGDAAVAMQTLLRANLINLALGPLLIFGIGPFPRLGVLGAAIATTIGRGIGVLIAVSKLSHDSGHLVVRREHIRIDLTLMGRLARMSASATFQMFVGSAAWMGLVRIIAVFGSAAVAGYTIAIRIVIFAILPAFGMSNAAATMVGQSLGANDPERAEKAVWAAARYNLAFLGGLGLLFLVFAPWIIGAFTTDSEAIRTGTFGLRTVAIGFPMFAYGMVLTQAFNGAGDTWTPTWINLGVYWAFEIPVALVLARNGFEWKGVFLAVTIGYSALAIVSGALFRRGKWKAKKV
jgi:putative MATE family efflux protein